MSLSGDKMKYMGSKSRIAKYIVPILQEYIDKNNIKLYVEPFVGGANVIDKINCQEKIGNDLNEYLIEFWKEIQKGWNPLDDVDMSKDYYDNVRVNKTNFPKYIVALCGLCATYNAKWFGGYAGIVHTKTGVTRNYYDEAVRNVLKQKENLKEVNFRHGSYLDLHLKNSLVYCDPPYKNTTKYKDDFNHDEYWHWVRSMSKDNIVLCSEYTAPEDFKCIWEYKTIVTLDNASRSTATERLFIHKSLIL